MNASTGFETCSGAAEPIGGLLALIKFFDLVCFREIFYFAYQAPCRTIKAGPLCDDCGHFDVTVYRVQPGCGISSTLNFRWDARPRL